MFKIVKNKIKFNNALIRIIAYMNLSENFIHIILNSYNSYNYLKIEIIDELKLKIINLAKNFRQF